jgi:hypothetical protein
VAEEVLVVGYEPEGERSRWPVVARVSPHVVVLRADPEELAEIARHARLAMVRSPNGGVEELGEQDALDELDEGARLYVRAWRERPAEKPDRPGEGLAWDHPGFEPPDRPPS